MALLVEAMRAPATSADDASTSPGSGAAPSTPGGGGTGSNNCRGCPLCQGSAWLHTIAPELVRTLADVTSAVSAGLSRAAERLAQEGQRHPGSEQQQPSSNSGDTVPDGPARSATEEEQA